MSDKPQAWHVVAGSLLILGTLALAFGGDIRRTDTYQRMFNNERWTAKQQQEAAAAVRMRELDKIECSARLRLEAELVPVTIERLKLQGASPDRAERIAMDELKLSEELCEERGI